VKRYLSATVARSLLIGGQIGYLNILSRYLTPADLGAYYFLLTVSYFLNAAIFIPFDYYQQSSVSKTFDKYSSLSPLISLNIKLLGASLLIAVSSAAVVWLMSPALSQFIVISVLLAVSAYLPQSMRGALNILGYEQKVVLSQALEGILKPLSVLATVTWIRSVSVSAVAVPISAALAAAATKPTMPARSN